MKKTLFIFLIALFSLRSFGQCIPDITTGLIADWKLTGNAIDSSASGYDGTVTGATLTTDRCGNINAAYHFNGIGTNQYITVPNQSPLSLSGTDFTISAWIKSDSVLANGTILSKRNGAQLSNGYIYFIDGTTQKLGFAIAGGGGTSFNMRSATAIDTLSWKHIVTTYDNTTDSMKMYVNGILDTLVGNVPSPTSTSSTFRIGNDSFGQAYEFKGKIDDIKIFNRVLDFCDVDSLYKTLCSPTTGLEAFFTANIKIFPNPNNGEFIISIPDFIWQQSSVSIYNSIGQQIHESVLQIECNRIILEEPIGMYYLTVNSKTQTFTTKIVIQ